MPSELLSELESLCGLVERPDTPPTNVEIRTLGLIALRDIVVNRPQERDPGLALILRCTVHADDTLRSKAIRMVVNQLHPLAYAVAPIEQFAEKQMMASCKGDRASDDALCSVSLFFALCTRSSALIPRLFEAYATAGKGPRMAFSRNMVCKGAASHVPH
jgi:hypothetical protein